MVADGSGSLSLSLSVGPARYLVPRVLALHLADALPPPYLQRCGAPPPAPVMQSRLWLLSLTGGSLCELRVAGL